MYIKKTNNKNFSEWENVFGDNVLANAILDRLLHHCKIFSIKGRSYKTKDIIMKSNKIN